jgi:hypothetical protein
MVLASHPTTVWDWLGLAVVGLPLHAIALRHRSRHQRAIIRSVRDTAAEMNDDELRHLVEALEHHHGDVEMRPRAPMCGLSAGRERGHCGVLRIAAPPTGPGCLPRAVATTRKD